MKRRSLIILGAVVLVGVLAFVSAFFIAGGGWLPQRDMMSLYDSVQAMRQEYDHVAEIRTITYLWPEGKILVSARSPEDATHVALNVVPIIYDGWPVVVTYSVIRQPADFRTASCTGPDWTIDPNPERWAPVRPLVGGLALLTEKPSAGGGGGGGGFPGEPPPMEIQGTGSGELFGHSSGIESLSTSSDTWAVGSLGLVTYDDFILTAAHVAAYDSGTGTFYGIGKPVYQGGEKIGELSAYIPVAPNTVNYADAALISMTSEVPRSPGTVFGEFGNYQIAGWTTVAVGDSVKKSGPMTNLTWGSVTHTNEQVPTDFGAYEVIFYDHIEVRLSNAYFAFFGDSGSAVSRDGQFVGLVVAMGMEYHWFWGYKTASFGYVTKAEHIIDGLGISLQPSTGGGGGGGPGFPPPLELLVERSSPS